MIAVARAAQECSTNLDGWQAVAIVVVVDYAAPGSTRWAARYARTSSHR